MDSRPRGRAALKDALIRSLRPCPGSDQHAPIFPAPGVQQAVQTMEMPRPRGRAELFKKLMQLSNSVNTSPTMPTPTCPAVSSATEQMTMLKVSDAEPLKKGLKGSSGTQIPITANYIKMHRDEGKGFHTYEVKFVPDVDSKAVRCKLVRTIVPDLGGVHIFNGMVNLYLPVQLHNKTMLFERQHPFSGENVRITITYKGLEAYGSSDSIHFLNVLFKRIMNELRMKQIGRNYFDFSLKKFIPQHALEIIPGYSVAVDEMEGGLMICLDTCHKLLRQKSVLELLVELHNANPSNFKSRAIDELLGQTVLTTYNHLNYIIDDIIWDLNPTHTFETKNGPISYIEYYKNQYGIEIQNHAQPLLLNMRKKMTSVPGEVQTYKICLIPELCNLTGISQDLMTQQFKKDMAEHTRLQPAKRFEVLRNYIRNVKNCPPARKILSDWGLSIDDGFIDLNARVIGDNKLSFKNRRVDLVRVNDWGRDIMKDNLINPIDMINWIVLCADRDRGTAERFVMRLRDLAKGFGCRIDAPLIVTVGKGTDLNYKDALERNANDHVQMMFVVVPVARESLYMVIKNTTLARKGILGQVALVRTLMNDKIASMVALKIGLQMQAKLGGSLWAMVFPSICNNFMFCGMDTFHSKIKKSVGALVCSIDQIHTRYYTGVAFQQHEIADAVKIHFQHALEMRRDVTGSFPSVVFIVRDGVSDGQLQQVKNYEMPQCLKVREELGANFKLCFIVIQKRVNQRFALRNGSNPPAGTVLDHTITRHQYEDFFLVPQNTRIGTVSPSHYIILHNDSPDLNLDRIQKLCFKLCHLYYNWTGAVSVPAPCQYAHKAAYLVGEHMERKPLDSLSNKLYYL